MDEEAKEVKKEELNYVQFLQNLSIPMEDKKKLLLGIAAIMVNTAEEATLTATAACMGMSIEDPRYVVFYNENIKPIVSLDIQTIYDDLARKVLTEEN